MKAPRLLNLTYLTLRQNFTPQRCFSNNESGTKWSHGSKPLMPSDKMVRGYNVILWTAGLILPKGQLKVLWSTQQYSTDNQPTFAPLWSIYYSGQVAAALYPSRPLQLLGLRDLHKCGRKQQERNGKMLKKSRGQQNSVWVFYLKT